MNQASTFLGIKIISSLVAVKTEQAKEHRWRSGQSISYHKRINKKWRKRYGTKEVPCAYSMTDPTTGERTMVVHPSVLAHIRAAFDAQAWKADADRAAQEAPARFPYLWPDGPKPEPTRMGWIFGLPKTDATKFLGIFSA